MTKPSSAKHSKNTGKSASFSFVLKWECINVGVFGQGESVVASPLSFHSGYAAMPTIPTDVLSVAQLARLRIDEAALGDVTDRFTRTLNLVAQLEEIDTAGVIPMSNPHDMHQRLRADSVTEGNQREALQQTAPAVEDGFFLVPKVID
jgi:aspartyl-tRNA(Asn)/glutamyl-tRNA(Gln) amidotransferase subunit C